MKHFISVLSLCSSVYTFSQVGINTSTPQKTLHVNGSLQITNELNAGGDATTAGSAGTSGQVLTSQGTSTAPQWKTLPDLETQDVIVKLYALGVKSAANTANSPANTNTTVIFDKTPKIDTSKVTYNSSTGIFTVLKSGYYQITTNVNYNMSSNASGQTGGTAQTFITNITQKNSNIGASSSAHGERTNNIYHSVVGIAYISAQDQVKSTMAYTLPFKVYPADTSFLYLGE